PITRICSSDFSSMFPVSISPSSCLYILVTQLMSLNRNSSPQLLKQVPFALQASVPCHGLPFQPKGEQRHRHPDESAGKCCNESALHAWHPPIQQQLPQLPDPS